MSELTEEIVISYNKPFFYIDIKEQDFNTQSMETMIELAKEFMVDLLWGEEETVLEEMQREGGYYSTHISNDEAMDIIEFFKNKQKE